MSGCDFTARDNAVGLNPCVEVGRSKNRYLSWGCLKYQTWLRATPDVRDSDANKASLDMLMAHSRATCWT